MRKTVRHERDGPLIRMAPIGIIGVGSYVPPREMSNDDWAEIVDTSDE